MRPAALPVLLTLLPATPPTWANVFTVRNANDSGQYSLRWAINRANRYSGMDLIRFAPEMAGQRVRLQTPLPTLTDNKTIISGNIDGDAAPDVALDGRDLTSGLGLVIEGDRCVVEGLALYGFPTVAISLIEARECLIKGCHLGVNPQGTRRIANRSGDIVLHRADDNVIGGAGLATRNIIAGGSGRSESFGISIWESRDNRITGNYVGLTRDGSSALSSDGNGIGITLTGTPSRMCRYNVIGGADPSESNVIAGLRYGMRLYKASQNHIRGNVFGLATDGNTLVPFEESCMLVALGSNRNLIGGARREKNVFAGAPIGITFEDSTTTANRVRSNYFGLNVDGTRQRRLLVGIYDYFSGGQEIGSRLALFGNYFATVGEGEEASIAMAKGGRGAIVRHNKFGIRPDGREVRTPTGLAVVVGGGELDILDNTIARAMIGIWVSAYHDPQEVHIFRNTIRGCDIGVVASAAGQCLLGNLGNDVTWDDGGNVFAPSNTWYIHNATPNLIKAEGCDFGTTSKSEINAKIIDRRDDPDLGRVDFIPLMGGVIPTGQTGSILALTGTSVRETAAGAQVTFSLSSAAQVQARILNMAGRPVRTLCRAHECEAGRNTLVWNALADDGLPVPNGIYVVELTATAEEGQQARALSRVTLAR